MKTLLEVVNLSADYLHERGIERAKREAEALVAFVLHLKRLDLYLQYDRPLDEKELQKCREVIKRRATGEPSQYIEGEVDFSGVRIKVGKDVLIPRLETEILVEKISDELKKLDCHGKVLWDMCTGSGCIAIALKKRFPSLEVVALDLSERALALARENAALNEVEITCLQGDLFEPLKGHACDFFVCNPPYVKESDFLGLAKEVKEFEPKMALIGGKSGLEFYERIAKEGKSHLKRGWLELGSGQGEAVLALFNAEGWQGCAQEKDWAGHDRFFIVDSA